MVWNRQTEGCADQWAGFVIMISIAKMPEEKFRKDILSQRENLCKRFGEVVRWEWLKLHDTLQVLAIHSLG